MFDHLDTIDQHTAALAGLSDDDYADIDGAALGDAILRLDATIRRLQAVRLQVTRAHSRSMAWKHDGAKSPAQWHRDRRAGVSGGQAARDVDTAQSLEHLPHTAAAVADGTVSTEQAAIAARASRGLSSDQTAALDEVVAATAPDATTRQLRDAVTDFTHRTAPDDVADRERQAFDRRSLRIGQAADGGWWLEGRLDVVGGELLATAVSTLSAPKGEGDDRSGEQRRADALADLADRAIRGGELPSEGTGRATVGVTADLATLQGLAGAPAAQLDRAGPVSGETARQLACDAGVHRVITDGASSILDVGRSSRTVTRAQRRALAARDGGCIGCGAPPGWTDAHHIVHWADGGPTDLDNLALLCRACHTGVHHREWRITRHPDTGRYTVRRPRRGRVDGERHESERPPPDGGSGRPPSNNRPRQQHRSDDPQRLDLVLVP